MRRANIDDNMLDDETCGWEFCCLPPKYRKRFSLRFLQFCATPQKAEIFLALSALLQGIMVNGLINASISTLQMRFQLRNSEAGLIASCYDIASCLSLLLVTYVGGRGHKPQWLGWGVVLLGFGGIVFSLPHFVASDVQRQALQVMCGNNQSNPSTGLECSDSDVRSNRHTFYFAQLITGIGTTPLYTLGVTYLDENVHQEKSSVYHGIFYAMSLIGPGLGYLFAGYFLTVGNNLDINADITEDDPRFIGAWWLPFVIFGTITIFVGFVLLYFPRQLPETEEVRKNRQTELFDDELAAELKNNMEFGKKLKDFPKSLLILLRNKTFVFISLAATADGVITSSLSTFGPRIVESLFRYSPSQSALIVGMIAIIGGAGGELFGGFLVFKYKMSVHGILKLCILFSFLAFLCFLVDLIECPNALFAGANIAYSGQEFEVGQIISACNKDCGCEANFFDPVCGSDGITYFSACYAGCNESNYGNLFSRCACIIENSTTSISTAKKGLCRDDECKPILQYVFLGAMFLAVFMMYCVAIPALQATIRIVLFSQRTFAVGVQSLLLRTLGTIPGPLFYGLLLDKACIVFGSSCGDEGSCNVFSNSNIRSYLSLLSIPIKGLGTTFYLFAYLSYHKENVPMSSGRLKPKSFIPSLSPIQSMTEHVESKHSDQNLGDLLKTTAFSHLTEQVDLEENFNDLVDTTVFSKPFPDKVETHKRTEVSTHTSSSSRKTAFLKDDDKTFASIATQTSLEYLKEENRRKLVARQSYQPDSDSSAEGFSSAFESISLYFETRNT